MIDRFGVVEGLLVGLLALLLVTAFIWWTVRPLERLARQAADLAAGSIPDRPPVSGPPEVRRLAQALNRIGQRLFATQGELERVDRLFRALLDHQDDGVLLIDVTGKVCLANPAIERILGRPRGQILGRGLLEVIWDVEISALVEASRRGRSDGNGQVAIVERSYPRRSWRAYAAHIDSVQQTLLVLRDLTDVRRLESMRRDFVTNISHELRTPITSIKALAETLEDGAIEDQAVARDFVGRIHQEAGHLAQLVEELLQLARVESGQAHLERRRIDLAPVIRRSVDRLGPLAERHTIDLSGDIAELPLVLADPERIGQVLSNLIHNAIKFTSPGGRVRVTAGKVEGEVRVAVTDSGTGLTADELARVFERFYKADRSRSGGGTGLGLAIAKHLIQAHGGRIAATSDGLGRGATFYFTLPLAEAARDGAIAAAEDAPN